MSCGLGKGNFNIPMKLPARASAECGDDLARLDSFPVDRLERIVAEPVLQSAITS